MEEKLAKINVGNRHDEYEDDDNVDDDEYYDDDHEISHKVSKDSHVWRSFRSC